MSEIIQIIESITANRESARLEINSSGTYGTLLFNEGRLVDARLGSLSGFQAVNALVALRDVEFSLDHVPPASHSSTITQSERVVLKRFFGIEAAEPEEHSDVVEPDPEWNTAPEHVVPLEEVEEIPQIDIEDMPTVEVARVPSPLIAGVRPSAFRSKPLLAVSLALVVALTVAAFALRSKMKARQQTATVAAAVVSEPTPQSRDEAQPVAVESVPPVVSAVRREANKPDEKVQDLTGEWRVINTVEKSAYKTFNNMKVGFRLVINQSGKKFTGKGEKFSENGQRLAAANRTPIRVTGSIDGDKVVATFVEDGSVRRTNGRFVWTMQKDGDGLAGTFVSTAANSSGRSAVTKQD